MDPGSPQASIACWSTCCVHAAAHHGARLPSSAWDLALASCCRFWDWTLLSGRGTLSGLGCCCLRHSPHPCQGKSHIPAVNVGEVNARPWTLVQTLEVWSLCLRTCSGFNKLSNQAWTNSACHLVCLPLPSALHAIYLKAKQSTHAKVTLEVIHYAWVYFSK